MSVRYNLVCHPETPTKAVEGVKVEVTRQAQNRIGLDYTLEGNRGVSLFRRGRDEPARTDGLWEKTCFEAFVMAGEGPGYVEYNFSSTEDWAAYQLDSYRNGMQNLHAKEPIYHRYGGHGQVSVLVDLTGIGLLNTGESLRLGLSAVLLDRKGRKSYWALAHPDGPPDFHDPACFTATLPAPTAR